LGWQSIKGELKASTFSLLNRTASAMSSSHLSTNPAKAIDTAAAETAETSTPIVMTGTHLSAYAEAIAVVNTTDIEASAPGPVSHRALVKSSSNMRQSHAKLSKAVTSSKKAKGYAKGRKVIGKGKEHRGGGGE
jgi:hypothetical protein